MDSRYLDHCYTVAGREIDPVAGQVSRHGESLAVGRKQLEVLALLAGAAGDMVPREAFIAEVWDDNIHVGQRGLTDAIYALRRLLEDSSAENPIIRTIPRRGYKLNAEVRITEREHSVSFTENWPVTGRPDWRLVRLLARNEVTETWLAETGLAEAGLAKKQSSQARRAFRFCRDEAHLQRLRREVTVLRYLRQKLADRGDILAIRAWRLDEPPYFLEMDYAAGGNLEAWATSRGGLEKIPLAERIQVIGQAAATLDAVHKAGVIHRNISPTSIFVEEPLSIDGPLSIDENLSIDKPLSIVDRLSIDKPLSIVDPKGQPVARLGEFGLGSLQDPSDLAAMELTSSGLTLTSYGAGGGSIYRPPEDEADGAAGDVFALGVVLYQLLVGDLHRPPSEHGIGTIAVPELKQILKDSLHRRPEARPSADELHQRLTMLDLARRNLANVEASAVGPRRHSSDAVGETIGLFRLLDVLGEGGMGAVYLAEQREPVERKVALKLIRAGMDSDQILARFEAERQALALMDHANVAAVYDAGCTALGLPYFAMEYVPGLELMPHCDRSKLGVHARVELFLQICDGVQHAHQKGLIHRDLKPSNLLVKKPPGQPATVKIIDFGVAKSLQRKLTANTVHTRLGTFVGTPRYSSPEQISGHMADVDTRADVYSLGVVLYELLAGVTPYSSAELADKSPIELVKLLSDNDPPTPFARFTSLSREEEEAIAEKRSQSVEHLKQRLQTDVAWIVLKCLERDPEDRYASVQELKLDLTRWLEDRPIEARPATRSYRLRKLIKRHRTAFALAALTTVILLATTTAAIFGLLRAEREATKAQAAAREAEAAADFQVKQLQSIDPAAMALGLRSRLHSRLHDGLTEKGVEPQAIEEASRQLDQLLGGVNLVDLTLDLLDGHFFEPAIHVVDEDYAAYPQLQARLWQSIADTLVEIGHYARAAPTQELALESRRKILGQAHPLTLESALRQGDLRGKLGQLEEARSEIEQTILDMEEHLGADDIRTLEAREDLGELLLHQYEWEAARGHFTDVLAARRRLLGDEHPDTLSTISNLAVLGYWTGDLESAQTYFDETLAGMRRVYGEAHPTTLAALAQSAGVYAEQGKPDRAIALQEEAVDGLRANLGDSHPQTLSVVNDLAVLLAYNKEYERAEPYFREVLRSQRLSIGHDSADTMTTMANLARLLSVTGRLDESVDLLQQAVEVFRRVLGSEHRRTQFFLFRLAKLHRDLGHLDAAAAGFRELASSQVGENAEEHPRALYALNELANVLLLKGQIDEAEALHLDTLEKQQRSPDAEPSDIYLSQSHLAEVLRVQGKLTEAEELLREALAGQQEDPGLEHEDTLNTMGRLCEILRLQGKSDQAIAFGEEASRLGSAFYHQDDHRLAQLKVVYGKALADLGRSKEAEPLLLEARRSLAKAGLNG